MLSGTYPIRAVVCKEGTTLCSEIDSDDVTVATRVVTTENIADLEDSKLIHLPYCPLDSISIPLFIKKAPRCFPIYYLTYLTS